jgi:hypothetical protein
MPSTKATIGSVSAILLGIVISGCDHGWGASGFVVRRGAKTPVDGANVAVQCPSKHKTTTTSSQPDGKYSLTAIGPLKPDCELVVEAKGYERYIGNVQAACVERDPNNKDYCWSVQLNIELEPSTAPKAKPLPTHTEHQPHQPVP